MHLLPSIRVPITLVITFLGAANLVGQAADAGAEDYIELTPFSISSEPESGYRSASAMAGARVATPLLDPRSAMTQAPVAISVIKRVDAVAVQFVLSHNADRQETRNQELYASVESIRGAIEKAPGMRMEQREVRFTGGDKKLFSVSRGGPTNSFVSILVLADLPVDVRLADRVKEVRDVLSATKLVGQTKYSDGSVGLYVKNPDQYRREILDKIFDDFAYLKKGFGQEFEILPSGLTQKVRMRVASESEVELWIDYSFSFVSVRALEGAGKD